MANNIFFNLLKKQAFRVLPLLTVLVFLAQDILSAQTLVINEFMAANQAAIKDPDFNAYADWIELYNPGTQAVDLKNYSITDDLTKPKKYIFTASAIVQPGQYIIVWADDAAKGVHTNFKLSASGEAIAIYAPDGTLVDSVSFGAQQTDISCGRFPNGAGEWFLFSPSSPGKQNLETAIFNKLAKPSASDAGGFFSSPATVTLSHPQQGAKIYYTLDGRTPTPKDSLYKSPIRIDSTTVMRFKAFAEGLLPSETISQTYFINENNSLPVFSLITDPANFFSDTTGIYVAGTNGIVGHCSDTPKNWNQEWERPVDLQLFEIDRNKGFKVSTGVQIFGGCSRIYDMKSLAFYFRGIYGNEKLNYKLFYDVPLAEYNNFILRSGSQDWWRTLFRDEMVHTLLRKGTSMDCQAYRPSILFINGKYWGIHNIREKINEHYLYYHFGVDENNIDLIEISPTGIAHNGDNKAYTAMINYLQNNNIANPANYEYMKSIVDIDNYIDYQLAQIYGANADWPGSNMKLWRERSANGRWRWLIFDVDFTFGGNANGMADKNTLALATATGGTSWPNPDWSTLMLRKMLENTTFRNEFVQRMAVHMATTFEPVHVVHVIDSIKALIASEIPRHKTRWVKSITMGKDWDVNVEVMRNFAKIRQPYVRSHFTSKFGISGTYNLKISVNNNSWGTIFLHNSQWTRNGDTATFFNNIPLRIKAAAMPGYRFARWEGASTSTESQLQLILGANASITAVFEPVSAASTDIVINEINYKSSEFFDTEDWVELYNPAEAAVDISNWKFSGNSNGEFYQFKSGTKIGPKGYLILCRDTVKFKSIRTENINTVGNIPFGLSSDGETILLKDNNDKVVDEVSYKSSGSWPLAANGLGATLALINPLADNSKPENWKASSDAGTPGKINDVYFTGVKKVTAPVNEFLLCKNYPNPFNPSTNIQYSIPATAGQHNSIVTLKVYDALGKEIAVLVNKEQQPGFYEVTFNASNFASGIYFYRLQAGANSAIGKMLLIK